MSTYAELNTAVDNLTASALKVKAERDKFYDALDNLLGAIDYARTGLDGCSDIDDKGHANWAMRLLQVADECEKLL